MIKHQKQFFWQGVTLCDAMECGKSKLRCKNTVCGWDIRPVGVRNWGILALVIQVRCHIFTMLVSTTQVSVVPLKGHRTTLFLLPRFCGLWHINFFFPFSFCCVRVLTTPQGYASIDLVLNSLSKRRTKKLYTPRWMQKALVKGDWNFRQNRGPIRYLFSVRTFKASFGFPFVALCMCPDGNYLKTFFRSIAWPSLEDG